MPSVDPVSVRRPSHTCLTSPTLLRYWSLWTVCTGRGPSPTLTRSCRPSCHVRVREGVGSSCLPVSESFFMSTTTNIPSIDAKKNGMTPLSAADLCRREVRWRKRARSSAPTDPGSQFPLRSKIVRPTSRGRPTLHPSFLCPRLEPGRSHLRSSPRSSPRLTPGSRNRGGVDVRVGLQQVQGGVGGAAY